MITALSIGKGGLGRFGNQCFTIAGIIGIATKSRQPYGFPTWKNYDNALFGDEVTDFSEVFVNKLPSIIEGIDYQEYGYFWGYRDIHLPMGNWTIDAHLQDPRYFEHCMPLIRETFRMKNEPDQNDYVAIHHRAGDYIADPAAYHPRCDMDYYAHAMRQFPDDTKFLIFSDDHEDAARVIPNHRIHKMCLSGSYLNDFAVMKKCKSFICANSSFSYFAALLGDHPEKKIILPRRWFGSSAGLSFDGYEKNSIII